MTDLAIHRHPVHSEFIGGEIKSSNIAFEDYSRMTTATHKLASSRRYDVPPWALNPADMGAVIVHAMERRSGLKKFLSTLSTNERLVAAQKLLAARRPELTARLDRLCKDYVEAKDNGEHERADALQIQIENIDTQLVMLDRVASVLTGVIYFYWRAGYNSVETAHELHIKPPHVRQILCRLMACAKRLSYPPGEPLVSLHKRSPYKRRNYRTRVPDVPKPPNHVPAGLIEKVTAMRRGGKFTVDIVRELDLGPNGCEIVTRIVNDMEVPLLPVGQEESNPGHRKYMAYCTRMGITPRPLIEWADATGYMLGDHGLRNKSITSYGQRPA